MLKTAYEKIRDLNLELDRWTRQLGVLGAVAERLHGLDEVSRILEVVIEEILAGLELKAAWVFLGDQKDRRLHLAASSGVADSYLEEVRTRGLGDCLCPEVFWTGHRMQARNTIECPRMPSIVEGLSAPVAHACIPLVFEGTTRGVLNVAARPGEHFSDDELKFLETLGHQACMAIERAEHLRTERLRNREARAIAAVSKAIGGSLETQALLQAVGHAALEILEADRTQILLGADPQNVTVAHLSGLPHPELVKGQPLDLVRVGAEGHARALAEQEVLCVDDASKDERVNQVLARRWEMGSGIAVPLHAWRKTLGLLVVSRVVPRPWPAEQVELAEALGAQASIALANARLYADARRAYQELKSAQTRALQTEKMAVLGTFASGLAHEVRNPLNSIALQLSILERRASRLEPRLAEEFKEIVGVTRGEIKRLDALVGDFLLFSRSTHVEFAPASLETLADEVVQLLAVEARARGTTLLRLRSGVAIPEQAMDAGKMKQVLINLVRNAVEAVGEDGRVEVETGIVDGRASIAVRDNGPGLPNDIDVFQLFVTTKPKGTGLGLPIAQQIVLEHGGEITAKRDSEKETSFTVWLPLARASREEEGRHGH